MKGRVQRDLEAQLRILLQLRESEAYRQLDPIAWTSAASA